MYKLIVSIFIYILIIIGVESLWGKYLATSILALLGIFVVIIGWLWFFNRHYKKFIGWLKQGADTTDKQKLSGFWREIADYVERLLKQKNKENQTTSEQLNKLLGAIQVSPNGVLLLDKDYKIEWCNTAAAKHFNLDITLDLKQYITNLIRDPVFIDYLESNNYQNSLKLTQGQEEQKLMIQIHPYDENRLLLLTNDITELERIEQMRRYFVADVSHEIRTPLTVLSGFIETIQTIVLDEKDLKHYLGLMKQQGDRMQSLVNDLLTLARLENSPAPPVDQWVSLVSILDHTRTTVEELSAGQHKIMIQGGEHILIAGIESELVSAVANIAVNAVRYTKPGGEIMISFELINGEGVFRVKDTGQGIPAQYLQNLTQRFYRIDKSRSRETGGTGLGLSIVKHVILRHGGRLDIQSTEGKGSTFSLILPTTRIKSSH